jgi:hypothetical protein
MVCTYEVRSSNVRKGDAIERRYFSQLRGIVLTVLVLSSLSLYHC